MVLAAWYCFARGFPAGNTRSRSTEDLRLFRTASHVSVDKIGADFHRLGLRASLKSPFPTDVFYGSGVVGFNSTAEGILDPIANRRSVLGRVVERACCASGAGL